MRVAILTMFNGLDLSYSLVGVVKEHISMLLNANITVRVLVSEDCPDSARHGVFLDGRIEWVKVTNRLNGERIHWRDYSATTGKVHESFEAETQVIAADLTEKLKDCDVCMMHDILYQGWHLVHNIAVRKAQKSLPRLKFLAFTHSMPVPRPSHCEPPFEARFTPMPNTRFIYPTQSGLEALAAQYGVDINDCSCVNHPYTPFHEISDDTKSVCKAIDMQSPQVIMVYPARLTMAKGLENVAMFAGSMAQQAEGVSVVFCDFPASDTPQGGYKKIIRHSGKQYGLKDENICFTSDLGYPNGFPHSSVLELFRMSNLFVCPSTAESFGLTVLEAAAAKNLLVLNQAVPALKELGERLGAYFMRWDAQGFGVKTTESYQPSRKDYYNEHCKILLKLLEQNTQNTAYKTLHRQFSPEYIFKTQLLPLLI